MIRFRGIQKTPPQFELRRNQYTGRLCADSCRGCCAVKLAGPKTVNFEGEEMSITKATRIVKGISYFVSPAPHWRYSGRFLNDIYEETYTYVEQ